MEKHQYIEQQRYACALGAFETLLCIEGMIPILHSGRGCGVKLNIGLAGGNGSQWNGQFSVHNVPCTGITDQAAIFGASEQLYEQVVKSQQILDGDMIMILTGCSAELIGDDVAEVASRFYGNEIPVLYAKTGGFLGSNLYGHHVVWESIVKQYLKKNTAKVEVNPKQVNIWGIMPVYDPFWYGTYCAVEELLKEVGLEPNFVYGPRKGRKAIDKIPHAAFNLVLSPWWDVSTVELLEKEFGTPFMHYPYLPIGAVETTKFLNELATYAGLDDAVVQETIRRHEEKFYYCLERVMTELGQARLMPRRFYSIANSQYTVSILKMMINEMGLLPEKQFITDGVPEKYQESIVKCMKDVNCSIDFEVEFNADGGGIQQELLKNPPKGEQLIFGTAWEKSLSRDLKSHFLCVSAPTGNRLIMNRTYFGYEGGLCFIEDYYGQILDSFQ